MRNIIKKINSWAEQRNLKTGNGFKQLEKLDEEVGELRDAIELCLGLSDDKLQVLNTEIVDAIGDIQVVLIVMCQQLGIDYDCCLKIAYNEIKGRTGKTVDGIFVKD